MAHSVDLGGFTPEVRRAVTEFAALYGNPSGRALPGPYEGYHSVYIS